MEAKAETERTQITMNYVIKPALSIIPKKLIAVNVENFLDETLFCITTGDDELFTDETIDELMNMKKQLEEYRKRIEFLHTRGIGEAWNPELYEVHVEADPETGAVPLDNFLYAVWRKWWDTCDDPGQTVADIACRLAGEDN